MIRTTLVIFNALGNPAATATEHPGTLLETYSGLLSAGTYYAEINSFGGHNEATAAYNAAQYFDSGGFFLTGTGVSVPEPTCLGLFAVVAVGFVVRRRA